ncbi:MAG TPA: hypothetical protein VM677_27175 [Actinokineospora sp.]|jgi:hypothetical protein|nr:hypothetical protein [Actinokineospora sp.]
MEIPAWAYAQGGEDIVIEPYLGAGPFGDTYGPAVTVRAIVDDKRRLVRGSGGDQVVASTTLFCPLTTDAPADSRVTVRGRQTIVIASRKLDGHALPVPSHVEVSCE